MRGVWIILTVFGEPGAEGHAGKAVTRPDKEATDAPCEEVAEWPGYGGGESLFDPWALSQPPAGLRDYPETRGWLAGAPEAASEG